MRFQLDHDWQGNMATPRPRVGENAKMHLLLVLCAVWILFGLTGHAPWKPIESSSITIVKGILDGGSLVTPLAAGEPTIESPPLYYLSAAISAKLLAPLFSAHDAARLVNFFWMSIVLLMVGMSGRELWAKGVGRHATFIMIGTIGLVMNAHSLNAEVATLAATASGFYALALSKRRPWRASGLLGLAIAVGFLSDGFIAPLILVASATLLLLLFKAWRTINYIKVFITALTISAPFIAAWLLLAHLQQPAILQLWLETNVSGFNLNNHFYFLRILIWYAWPALPLALWGLWRNRAHLLVKPKFQLVLVFFVTTLVILGFGASSKDINAMPLLLPLVALGAGSVEHLKRGAAAALNWFGISLFGLIGFLIWLGWIAMMSGHPAKIKQRMQFLSGSNDTQLHWVLLLLAIFMTVAWLFTCVRAKQSNRSAVTNWAVGMTFGWGLLMTLWLPWIDAAKSYQPVFASMMKAIPKNTTCISSLEVGYSQRMLMSYYSNIDLQDFEKTNQLTCNYYLIQDMRGNAKMQPGDEWKLIWSGKRAADRKESFRLYQRQ
jgi:4-amino-4-deoxy-L-arabinose transferase-like glycosyltransferase